MLLKSIVCVVYSLCTLMEILFCIVHIKVYACGARGLMEAWSIARAWYQNILKHTQCVLLCRHKMFVPNQCE